MDRAQVQIVGLHRPGLAFGVGEVLVGGDHPGAVEPGTQFLTSAPGQGRRSQRRIGYSLGGYSGESLTGGIDPTLSTTIPGRQVLDGLDQALQARGPGLTPQSKDSDGTG
jgi:hypothetical protein